MRLINGEQGGRLGYAMWRRCLRLAHGYTATHKDGIVKYTAHEKLRHVCAIYDRSARIRRAAVRVGICREPYVLNLCDPHLAQLQRILPKGGMWVVKQYQLDGSETKNSAPHHD